MLAGVGRPVLTTRRRSPEHRSHPGLHLLHAQRLGYIVVGAYVQPLHQVVLAVERRDEDDGSLRRRRALPQPPRHLEPRHLAHHHIKQNQRKLVQRKLERLFGRMGRSDLKAFRLQVVLQYLADVLFVVYNKYSHKSHTRFGVQR